MALSIKDAETEKLARTRAAADARKAALIEDIQAMERRLKALPIRDHRSADEIIGYDEHGLPK